MSARCRLALLLAACWSTAQAAADQHDGSAPSERRVGFSPLTGELAAEHRYLAETLPWLLRERLAGIDGVELVDADAPVGVLPRQVAAARDIDLLIWGTIDSAADHLVAGHLVLELRAFDAASVRTVWSYYEAGQADALQGAIDAAADGLAPLLLGQAWSRLAVEPVPADSTVRLDGVLVGVGTTLLRYTAPRRATLTVVAAGLSPVGPAGGVGAGAGAARRRGAPAARPGHRAARLAADGRRRLRGVRLCRGDAAAAAASTDGRGPCRWCSRATPTPPRASDRPRRGRSRSPCCRPASTAPPSRRAAANGSTRSWAGSRYRSCRRCCSARWSPTLPRATPHLHDGGPIAWQPATIGVTVGAVAAAGYSVYRLVRTIGVMIEYTETADRPAG